MKEILNSPTETKQQNNNQPTTSCLQHKNISKFLQMECRNNYSYISSYFVQLFESEANARSLNQIAINVT